MSVIEIRALNDPDRASGQTMGDFGMKTIDLLIAMFPGKAQIPATFAGRALGYADSSVRNMIHKAPPRGNHQELIGCDGHQRRSQI